MTNRTRRITSMFVLGGLVALGLPRPVCAEEAAKSSAVQPAISPKDGVIRLFDGRTLGNCDVWLKDTQHEDPRHVFRVTDGMLHVTGDGMGALITRDRYRNYHLVLEYKWGERTWHEREKAARDSGLLIHSNGKLGGYDGAWMPSIEANIIEGGVGDFVFVPGKDDSGRPVPLSLTANVGRDRDGEVIWKKDGERETFQRPNWRRINWFGRDPDWRDEKGFRGPQDPESPHGQWTRMDVLSDEGHIQVFVNGVKVNEAFDASPSEGRLQLQSELAEIFYRRWELWPLDKGPKIEAAK
jgi:3-keto-disaccharide hydrolase